MALPIAPLVRNEQRISAAMLSMRIATVDRPSWLNWASQLMENAKFPPGFQRLRIVDFAGVKFGDGEFDGDTRVFVTVTNQSFAIYRHYRGEHPLLKGEARYASTARYGGTARATGCHGAYVVTNVVIWRGEQPIIGELSVYPLSDGDHRIGLSPLPKEQQDAFMVTPEGDLMLRPS